MLDYVARLTREPSRMTPEDLQINLIASWFNYINRVANGLGVGR
jgi:hypothetical protein